MSELQRFNALFLESGARQANVAGRFYTRIRRCQSDGWAETESRPLSAEHGHLAGRKTGVVDTTADGAVTVVDLSQLKVIRTIKTDEWPHGVAVF
jgi:hypothetical protein